MAIYNCRHSRRRSTKGKSLLTLVVNGVTYVFYSSSRSCHEAAYRAIEIALRLARRLGATNVTIFCGSPLVRNQMANVWKTRAPAMKARRAACNRVRGAMKVQYL